MSETPSVYTIILNWNGLADTRECLNSLRSADYPANRVVVIDNGSETDEAAALEGEFAGFIEVMRNPANLGFAGGMNIGIKRALEQGADYVLLLNNDVTVDRWFLEELIKGARMWPDLGAACPTIYFFDDPDRVYSTGGMVNLWLGSANQTGRGGVFPEEPKVKVGRKRRSVMITMPIPMVSRDYADGACMLMSREAIERVGLLDEGYFMYWEETDWCYRARKMGFRCYWVPQAKVWHKAARSLASDDDFHYRYERNALMFVRKRGNGLQLATALLAHLLVYAPSYLIRRRIGRARAELRAVLWNAGLRNHPRQRPLV